MNTDDTLVCRACLTRENLQNITENYLVGRTVFSIFCECTGLNLSDDVDLDGEKIVQLCSKCQGVLVQFFEFKNRVLTHLSRFLRTAKIEDSSDVKIESKDEVRNTATNFSFHCPTCLKPYLKQRQAQKCLEHHILENGGVECNFCGRKYRRSFLSIHIRRVHNRDRYAIFPCEICGKTFTHENSVVNHKHWTHKKATGKFKCNTCSQVFRQQSKLDEHIRVKHVGNYIHHCTICKKVFVTADSLKNHLQAIHIADKFTCSYCGKQFAHKSNYITHEKLHREDATASYQCKYCDFITNTLNNLKRHQVVHSDVKKYMCSVCGANFRTCVGLKLHDLVHQEKRFTCNICQKMFRRSQHLKSHIQLIHIKE